MGSLYWPDFCGNRSEYDAFWSPQLTLNTSSPDLTLCMQQTALTWPPVALLLLATPLHLWSLRHRPTVNGLCSFSIINLVRTLSCVCMVVCSALLVVWAGRPSTDSQTYVTPAEYVATGSRLTATVIVLGLLRWDYMKGLHTSGLLSLYWLFTLLLEIAQCRSNALRQGKEGLAQSQGYFITYNTYFALLILQFLLSFFVNHSTQKDSSQSDGHVNVGKQKDEVDNSKETSPKPCPHDLVCFWSRSTFMWLTRDILRGYRKVISFESLYALRPEITCKALLKLFNLNYFTTHDVKVGSETPTGERPHRALWFAIFLTIGWDLCLGISLRAITIPIQFLRPQLLRVLIDFIESEDSEAWKGIMIAVGMLVVNFSFSLFINCFIYRIFVAGMKARSIVNAVVYRKALRLSSTARKQTTIGQVVNLMSVDAQKVQDLYIYANLLWTLPIMITLCIVFLWQTIGPSCLAGLGVLMIFLPLNGLYLANKAFRHQKKQMSEKDKRFRVMNEILSGMKVLKLYAWEPSFASKILSFRNLELTAIKYVNYINAFGSMTWLLAPYLVTLAIFTTYVLVDDTNVLTASKAFVTLSLVNMLNFPMSFLPLAVANTSQGIVSVKRIQNFLELDELDEDGSENDPTMQKNKIEVSNASFSWGRSDEPTLKDITLTVPRGGLVAVVGAVGSGKSSLISAILGEMFRKSGDIKYNGNFAFVPQQAWIVHNSLRENITFGKAFNKRTYDRVVRACALKQDLAMLPGGDETEIGEKGINLSGGQKQRVSLARAVYQDEDIYLLDDPLSAVDAHVGKHIFEHVIGPNGVLKDKTRVLVTHGITYLPHCDHIVVLKDGKIEDSGSYEQLTAKEGAFSDVIRSYLENEADEESDEETDAMRDVLSRFSNSEGQDDMSLSLKSDGDSRPGSRRVSRKSSRRSSARSRRSSTKDQKVNQEGLKLIKEEKAEEGSIGLKVIVSYVKACGYLMMNAVFWSHLFYIVFQILTNVWLSEWTSDKPVNGTYSRDQSLYRVSVYGYLGIGQVLTALIEAFAVAHGCFRASRALHMNLLDRIVHAPMSFFDTTPLGRIMNRFSKDVDVLDSNLPMFIRQWLFSISPVIVTIILICYITPIFIAVIVPIGILYVLFQRLYVVSMRQWKRIDSVRRSPIYIHFDESVSGSSSIRAYRKEEEFVATCDRLINESQRPWYLIVTAQGWCRNTMELLGAFVVFFSTLFAVLQKDVVSPSQAGLSVTYALQVTVYLSAVIRNSSELETYIVSVERIDEYLNINSEASWEVKETAPPASWPETGTMQFSDYSTRYRKGLDLVLKNINCTVKSGERIGIVGRTGAGKSSLSLALFRIIEAASGHISIDGRLVSDMGLHNLRRQISIIPQDPVVFSGSLRSNLDPFDLYTDLEVWQSLEHAHLKGFVTETDEGLEYECGENGEALSVGQRQLLCLARALLRKSKILVLDEATAAVDFETDSLIQTTIREKFKHCTILTVAHRLHTVLDYDRIMVLDQGKVIELDSPDNLLSDESTVFHSMAKDAGLAIPVTSTYL